jgi:hypothetical protein
MLRCHQLLHKDGSATPGATGLVRALNECSFLVIFAQVESDEEQNRLAQAAAAAHIAGPGKDCILPSHRLTYASTGVGRLAIVRQVDPIIHLDAEDSSISEVSRFVKSVKLLKPSDVSQLLISQQQQGVRVF